MVVRLSTVFRANRLTDFVRMSPMRPASASSTMRLKPSRLRVDVPEMPSSLYTPASSHVLSRSLYNAVGKSGVHTRIVGLDRETNKELLLKHMREKGNEGAPLRELQQVLPGHNRSQIQVLLRELRDENRAYCIGRTSAAKWFAVPSSTQFT